MRFEYGKLLWLLLIVLPALIAFFWWAARAKRRLLDRFVNPRLLGQLMSGISPRLQNVRFVLLIAAAAFLVVALARPQWGFDFEEVKQRGLDIIIAVDTSRSMLAEDVAPNRLARAKLAALDLRKLAKADRMGLIAFAGSAFLQCPLSSDEEVFRQSVNELNVNIIPQGGTALAEAIDCARTAFKDKGDNHKVLVMFTDGEDHDGNAVPAAKAAGKDGLHIFTIGVGTPNGENLRITDARGRSEYVTDTDGQKVTSKLNDQLLKEIAEASAGPGFYSLLGGARTMEILYERGLAPLPKGELGSLQIKRYHDRFQWFLFFAMIVLVAEIFVPERKRSARKLTSAAPELARAAVFLLFLGWCGALGAASASKAQKEYGTGRYERALHQYQDLLQKQPDEPRLNFNAGDAAFQAGFYDRAQKHFNYSLATEDLQLQERSFYNLGNTQYRLGEEESDPSKKKGNWEQAVTSYDSALKLNPDDPDAKYNLELVKKKLEELNQQQQQQKQDNRKQDKSDDKKDQQQDQQKNQDQKDQSKSEQQKNEEKQKQQQKQQEQQQQKPEDQQQQQAQKPDDKQDKKDPLQQQAQPQPGNEDKDENDESQEPGKPMKKIQMTPQQAIRLLESLKNDERTLVFLPPFKTNRNERAIKNW